MRADARGARWRIRAPALRLESQSRAAESYEAGANGWCRGAGGSAETRHLGGDLAGARGAESSGGSAPPAHAERQEPSGGGRPGAG